MTKRKLTKRKPSKRNAQKPKVLKPSAQLAPALQRIIQSLRKDIDAVDGEIAMLVKKRTAIAARIIALKTADGEPIVDRKREHQILKRYALKLTRPITSKQLKALVTAILQLTPRYRANR